MNAEQLRSRTADELRDELSTLKREAFNLRFRKARGDLDNTNRIREVRRDTARVKTVLKELAGGAGAAAEETGMQ